MSLRDCYKDLIADIRSKQSAVFVGAGISVASGLPIVSFLLAYIFSKLEITDEQCKLIYDSNLPFESIMEMILRESGLYEIQEIYGSGQPNTNHIFIAKICKLGFLKLIYTTNFDTLIEQALEIEGLTKGEDFFVYSSEAEFNLIPWSDDSIKVVKIHGCVSKKEDMIITMSLIASDQYTKMRKELMSKIFKAVECENVIILGYSCSDLDLTPLIESFNGKKANIFFIEHVFSPTKTHAEDVSLKKIKNPFSNYSGIRLSINTDDLIRLLWNELLRESYIKSEFSETNWRTNVDDWYLKSVDDSGQGVKHHIAGRLLYAIGEFNEAIDHNSKAIAIALRDKNLRAYSSEVGNLGMAFNAIGDYDLAIDCFKESIPLCRRIGNVENLASQLQSYGNVLHHIGDDAAAIQMHTEALALTKAGKDDFLISNILGNLSNSYNKLSQFDNALRSLEKALKLSRKLGNKQAESSQLGILSITYLSLNDYNKALECSLAALEIKVAIADKQGECVVLGNLVGIYRLLGIKEKALEVANRCSILARRIGNTQIQQLIELNLALLDSEV